MATVGGREEPTSLEMIPSRRHRLARTKENSLTGVSAKTSTQVAERQCPRNTPSTHTPRTNCRGGDDVGVATGRRTLRATIQTVRKKIMVNSDIRNVGKTWKPVERDDRSEGKACWVPHAYRQRQRRRRQISPSLVPVGASPVDRIT